MLNSIKFSNIFFFIVLAFSFVQSAHAETIDEKVQRLENQVALLERKVEALRNRPSPLDLIKRVDGPDVEACYAGGYRHSLLVDLDKSGTPTDADKVVFKFHSCLKGDYLKGTVNTNQGYWRPSDLGCYYPNCFEVGKVFGKVRVLNLGHSNAANSRVYFANPDCNGTPYLKTVNQFIPGYEQNGVIQFFSSTAEASTTIDAKSVLEYNVGKAKYEACRTPTSDELKFKSMYPASFDGGILSPGWEIKHDDGGVLWY